MRTNVLLLKLCHRIIYNNLRCSSLYFQSEVRRRTAWMDVRSTQMSKASPSQQLILFLGNPVPLRRVQGATPRLGKVVERREVQMPVRKTHFLTILHSRETIYSNVRRRWSFKRDYVRKKTNVIHSWPKATSEVATDSPCLSFFFPVSSLPLQTRTHTHLVNLSGLDPCMFNTNTNVWSGGSSKQPGYLGVNKGRHVS